MHANEDYETKNNPKNKQNMRKKPISRNAPSTPNSLGQKSGDE